MAGGAIFVQGARFRPRYADARHTWRHCNLRLPFEVRPPGMRPVLPATCGSWPPLERPAEGDQRGDIRSARQRCEHWTRVTVYVNNVRTTERVETNDRRAQQDVHWLSVGVQGASPLLYAPGIAARGYGAIEYQGGVYSAYTAWGLTMEAAACRETRHEERLSAPSSMI